MKRSLFAALALSSAAIIATGANSQVAGAEDAADESAHAADIIAARKALMAEIASFMPGIDRFAIGEPGDVAELRIAAGHISQLLLALPHLFPPATNIYEREATAEFRSTVALPAIWEDFDSFYAAAAATTEVARRATEPGTEEAFRAVAGELRASCDSCHAQFVQAYVVPLPGRAPADLNFPFLQPR